MYPITHSAIPICFALIASASLAAASDHGPKPEAVTPSIAAARDVAIEDLQPFARTAYIPAGADLSSIRFESVKAVTVATKRASITSRRYCDAGFEEPGGSMYCPSTRDESPAPAYRVTYSFSGPPMASDESGNTHFTFSVYFHPDDLSPTLRQAISAGKTRRAEIAPAFKVAANRDSVQRIAIDEANSSFCEARYIDGLRTHTDRNCEDKVTYKAVAVPSGYITVKVDPVSPATPPSRSSR